MVDEPRSPEDSGEIDSLGAAPTRAVGGAEKSDGGRRVRLPRSGRRRRPLARVLLVIGLIIALALVPALLSSLKKTPRNMVGISYGGGPIEAAHFQKIVQPGSGLFFNGLGDSLYLYPADTQSYIVSKSENEGNVRGVDSIISPSRDRVQIEYQVAVYFKLNVDRLKDFHDQLGLQYAATRPTGGTSSSRTRSGSRSRTPSRRTPGSTTSRTSTATPTTSSPSRPTSSRSSPSASRERSDSRSSAGRPTCQGASAPRRSSSSRRSRSPTTS
jgi:SPFH domain / Band 7 family